MARRGGDRGNEGKDSRGARAHVDCDERETFRLGRDRENVEMSEKAGDAVRATSFVRARGRDVRGSAGFAVGVPADVVDVTLVVRWRDANVD